MTPHRETSGRCCGRGATGTDLIGRFGVAALFLGSAVVAAAPVPVINPQLTPLDRTVDEPRIVLSREHYLERLEGFWLGQSLANWTGLITEMDKIGGEGPHGDFYTREDWGAPDQPSIWDDGKPSTLSPVIDWYVVGPEGTWGADDDTDIEYLYQHLMFEHEVSVLSAAQIRDGWLRHIYSDENTPFRDKNGKPENYLWVSNQAAHDLMRLQGLVPPATSDPALNPHTDMIDAQLTTELFGLFAPGRPELALRLSHLPIRTTARGEATLAAEFYVILHALAAARGPGAPDAEAVLAMAIRARHHLPDASTTARMFDFVSRLYRDGVCWEAARDAVYQRYQVAGADGYDVTTRNLYCNGCFASGINFAASLVSLFWGEGDYLETVRIAALTGWDSDNPAATWGGWLGFMLGAEALEQAMGQPLSRRFDIHRTRGGFPNGGKDDFHRMARKGVWIVDRVVQEEANGWIDGGGNRWLIPVNETPAGAGAMR